MKNTKIARYWKYRFKHKRTIKTIKSVIHKGFKITVEKDKTYGIPYSAFIEPISQSAKSVCTEVKNIRIKKIPDYTGWVSVKEVIRVRKKEIGKLYKCRNYKYHYELGPRTHLL